MIPLIVVASDPASVKEYVQGVAKKQSIDGFSISHIEPANKEITIGQVRAIQKETILRHANPRLFVLWSFDHANIEAQNAFLKTLEELIENNQFVLVCQTIDAILPTIRSRAKIVFLGQDAFVVDTQWDTFLQGIQQSKYAEFLYDTRVAGISRDKAERVCLEIIHILRTRLLHQDVTVTHALRKALNTHKLIQRNNANPQLALDSMLLLFKKDVGV